MLVLASTRASFAAAMILCIAVVAFGCSSSSDTGTAGGACMAPLDQMPGYADCGSTYDDGLRVATSHACGYVFLTSGACNGYQEIMYDWVTHWQVCVYSGTGSSPNVGAWAVDDTPEFCGGTSSDVRGGTVPDKCMLPTSMTCPDAGADAGSD